MKDFYVYRLKATPERKEKFGTSGIAVISGRIDRDTSGKVINREKYNTGGKRKIIIGLKVQEKMPKDCRYEADYRFEYIDKDKEILLLEPEDSEIMQDNFMKVISEEIVPVASSTGKTDFDFELNRIRCYGKISFSRSRLKSFLDRMFHR